MVGHEVLVWEHFGSKALGQGNFKLAVATNGPWKLYVKQADRSKINNLAAKILEKVAELRQWYLQKIAAAGV